MEYNFFVTTLQTVLAPDAVPSRLEAAMLETLEVATSSDILLDQTRESVEARAIAREKIEASVESLSALRAALEARGQALVTAVRVAESVASASVSIPSFKPSFDQESIEAMGEAMGVVREEFKKTIEALSALRVSLQVVNQASKEASRAAALQLAALALTTPPDMSVGSIELAIIEVERSVEEVNTLRAAVEVRGKSLREQPIHRIELIRLRGTVEVIYHVLEITLGEALREASLRVVEIAALAPAPLFPALAAPSLDLTSQCPLFQNEFERVIYAALVPEELCEVEPTLPALEQQNQQYQSSTRFTHLYSYRPYYSAGWRPRDVESLDSFRRVFRI